MNNTITNHLLEEWAATGYDLEKFEALKAAHPDCLDLLEAERTVWEARTLKPNLRVSTAILWSRIYKRSIEKRTQKVMEVHQGKTLHWAWYFAAIAGLVLAGVVLDSVLL